MMRSKVHLALQAVVCIALLILLSVSAVEIYREDSAYKTADPMENIIFNFVGQVDIPILTESVILERAPRKKKTA